eukprot:scaffold2936_cov113-Cylindrotheca_fusiformis.AAC.7
MICMWTRSSEYSDAIDYMGSHFIKELTSKTKSIEYNFRGVPDDRNCREREFNKVLCRCEGDVESEFLREDYCEPGWYKLVIDHSGWGSGLGAISSMAAHEASILYVVGGSTHEDGVYAMFMPQDTVKREVWLYLVSDGQTALVGELSKPKV